MKYEMPCSSAGAPSHVPPADPILTAESYVAWLLERCCGRRDQSVNGDRRRLYEERVTILFGFRSALASPHAAFRDSARRTLGSMTDIRTMSNHQTTSGSGLTWVPIGHAV